MKSKQLSTPVEDDEIEIIPYDGKYNPLHQATKFLFGELKEIIARREETIIETEALDGEAPIK